MDQEINLKIQCELGHSEFSFNMMHTIGDLKAKITALLKTKFNFVADEASLVIKYGFPPKAIKESDNSPAKSICLTNNELLRLEFKKKEIFHSVNESTQTNSSLEDSNKSGKIERVIIPADNSCLFNAINYCINQSIAEPELMREIVVSSIQSNPQLYNAAILDKEPNDYCDWIMQKETWGGGIEVAILSNFFQVKIGVADITKVTIEYFGEVHSY